MKLDLLHNSYLIKVDGTIIEVEPDHISEDGEEKTFSMKQLENIVGGHFEMLSIEYYNLLIIVNDNGIKEKLSENLIATLLYGYPILGDVLILPVSFID